MENGKGEIVEDAGKIVGPGGRKRDGKNLQ